MALEAFRPDQRVNQVDEQARDNDAGERIVDAHSPLLKFVAGDGIEDREREGPGSDRDQNDVQHGAPRD